MKRTKIVSLKGPIITPLGAKKPSTKQAIGGRAIKTSDVVTSTTVMPELPAWPLTPVVSIACFLPQHITQRDVVQAGLTLPGKFSLTTIGMVYDEAMTCDADIVLHADATTSWAQTLRAICATQHYDIVVWLESEEAMEALSDAILILRGSPHWIMVLPGKASCAIQTSRMPRDMNTEALVKNISQLTSIGPNIVKWGAPS